MVNPPSSRFRVGRFGWLILGIVAAGVVVFVLNSGPTLIKNADLARDFQDNKLVGSATLFKPEDNPLHCVVKLERAVKGTRLRFVWTAVDANGVQNYKLLDREIVIGDNQSTVDAFLKLDQPWPPGQYKVEVYLDDKFDRMLPFSVS